MKETQFNLDRLRARRIYKGGEYTKSAFRPLERTGAEWRDLAKGCPAKRITDTDVLVYDVTVDRNGRGVRSIRYEVYVGA